jgi:hypothetical protein
MVYKNMIMAIKVVVTQWALTERSAKWPVSAFIGAVIMVKL